MLTYLITGGAGFIGSNFLKYILKNDKDIFVIVLDKLNYAGNINNIKKEIELENVLFVKGDICDTILMKKIFLDYNIDFVINFAAETHVDRSIVNPEQFFNTNIYGLQNLLDIAKKSWTIEKKENSFPIYKENKKFLQISTDEVYGSLEIDIPDGKNLKEHENSKVFGSTLFTEKSPLNPSSPYSASKASADMIAISYYKTYGFPISVTRSSNNYGPNQFKEKLIPMVISKIENDEKIPVYGSGINVRNWIYVKDNCECIDLVLKNGESGEIYNIGSLNEEMNIDVINTILEIYADINGEPPKYHLITYVEDRIGHDLRYGVDCSKVFSNFNWFPKVMFEEGINIILKNKE